MIRAVLFDLDNTLIDFMKMKTKCIDASITAMTKSGLKMSKKKAEEELFKLYDVYGIEYEFIFQKFLKKVLGKVDLKILASGIVAYRQVRAGYLEPYHGVKDTLKALKRKGLKLGIVTDAPKVNAWIRLVSMGVEDYFDVIVCSGIKKKPDSLPFRKALKQLGVKPTEALMIGDWPERDVTGAKRLGIKSCFAKYGYVGTKKVRIKPDCEINCVEDILKIV